MSYLDPSETTDIMMGTWDPTTSGATVLTNQDPLDISFEMEPNNMSSIKLDDHDYDEKWWLKFEPVHFEDCFNEEVMPPERRSYRNTKHALHQPIITKKTEPTENVEEELDNSGVTYFVDEDGRYYYQPEHDLEVMPTMENTKIIQDQIQVEETPAQQTAFVENNAFQTVTLVPSKDCKGEISYVLLVQQEAPPLIEVDIKEEKPTMDVYSFDEDEAAPEPKVMKPQVKKKRRPRGSRAKFTCNFCNYSSHRRYLLVRHMKSHSEERPHKCEVCERGFKTVASLQNHTNMHNGVKPHNCKFCGSTFTTSGELVRHVRYKHTHEKPHKCTECEYASVELSKLRRHVRCHTGERPYQCPHCTYASPDTFKLKRHLRTHTGEKPYKCDMCTMCFTQSNSLKAHRLIHNVSDKPMFACQLCPAKCGRKTDLRIHVQKLHTSEKPLKCKRCGKSFPDRYSCKMHNKTHEGEKCYKCDLCPYASTTMRHLKSHLLKHTDEKPYACDDCDQSFRQKQLLRRHQNLYHNPNYVPKAPKEKTHTCHECSRVFAHKGNLIRHLAIHDPESGHKERALALKIGRQKKVKYIDSETLKMLKEQGRNQLVKIDHSTELKRGEVVTVDDGAGQQYVVLEIIQLEDGTEQQVAVVAPDYVTLHQNDGEDVVIEIEDDSRSKDDMETDMDCDVEGDVGIDNECEDIDVAPDDIEMETISQFALAEGAEDAEDEEEEEEEEEVDMETKMLLHIQNQERAAAERSIKLEQEVGSCFGFEEEPDSDDALKECVFYEII